MMIENDKAENSANRLLCSMGLVFVLGITTVSVFWLSPKNLISFVLGGGISALNFLWLRRLVLKLSDSGKFTKRSGIEWGMKILIIFGSITILILKAPLNILIFVFGLSILPIAVMLDSVFAFIKLSGGR
jgi:hypothetical protein